MQVIMERFWKYVHKTDDCWEWTGAKKKTTQGNTYGQLQVSPHRISYEHHHGPIESGKHVHHRCGNTLCVNPDHLQVVTPMENNHFGPSNATKTHCPKGHEYTEDNIYLSRGRRLCRTCRRQRSAEQAVQKKEARHARGLRWGNPHGSGLRPKDEDLT